MFWFAVERDLQTLQLQAKAGSHPSNLMPAFLMLYSPRADDGDILPDRIPEHRLYPPVVETPDSLRHHLWKVLRFARPEGVDIQDDYRPIPPLGGVSDDLEDCRVIPCVVRSGWVHHEPYDDRAVSRPTPKQPPTIDPTLADACFRLHVLNFP